MKSLTCLPVVLLLFCLSSNAEDSCSLWGHLSSVTDLEGLRSVTASFDETGNERVLMFNATTSRVMRNIAWLDVPAPVDGWDLANFRNVEATITNAGSKKVGVMLWVVAHRGFTAVGEESSLDPGETATICCDLRKTYRDGSPIIDPGKIRRIRIMTKGADVTSLKVRDLIASGKADDWMRPRGRLDVPDMTIGAPAPGKRVRYQLPADPDNDVYCALYLPTDWKPGGATR